MGIGFPFFFIVAVARYHCAFESMTSATQRVRTWLSNWTLWEAVEVGDIFGSEFPMMREGLENFIDSTQRRGD